MGVRPDPELIGAIEQAYRTRYARFLKVAVAILGDREQGRDAVQETFARAVRARGELRQIDRIEGWLWRTLINVCLVERRHPVERLDHVEELASNGHADAWPEVRSAIAALPERQRLALFLRHYADLDYHQIAEAIGIERGTVAATLHAAHQKLKAAITEVTQ